MIDVSKALPIFGWMLPDELRWLGWQAAKHKRILEVGSCCGRSTMALAEHCQGQVTAVDVWLGGTGGTLELFDEATGKAVYDIFEQNLKEHIASGKVRPVRMLSVDAANMFSEMGEQFDMIFIDATHNYGNVKADIEAWRPLLAAGGLLCGHDFGRYSGLDRAVRELVPSFRLAPWPCSIWHEGHLQGSRPAPVGQPFQKKVLFTLNVNNYAPELTTLTYPLLKIFANKMSADFYIISDRMYPDYPITFEKLQIYHLARQMQNDWNIYLDSDALVNPDTFDPTEYLSKDMVMHNGNDMAGNRFRYDRFFRRDGRHIGSGNWFTIASDWCVDLWKPPDDMDCATMLNQIQPTVYEQAHGITRDHLIDDYVLSRNISKYGLHFMGFKSLAEKLGRSTDYYLWHQYTMPVAQKLAEMKKTLVSWGLAAPDAPIDPIAAAVDREAEWVTSQAS